MSHTHNDTKSVIANGNRGKRGNVDSLECDPNGFASGHSTVLGGGYPTLRGYPISTRLAHTDSQIYNSRGHPFSSAIAVELTYRRGQPASSTDLPVPPVELPPLASTYHNTVPNPVSRLSVYGLDPERSPSIVPGSYDNNPLIILGQRSELIAVSMTWRVEIQITSQTARLEAKTPGVTRVRLGRSEAQEPRGRVHGFEDAHFNRTYWWLVSRLYHRDDVLLIILARTAHLGGDVRLLAFEDLGIYFLAMQD
ncbi:hypothetical protein EDD17DRAFT_1504512 [Pisolithus thermaeus]|nr:hypothetical protein EDD17DRAFT_1504512 [Pisolithus thermaeus]